MSREEKIEDQVRKILERREIYPFNITYTFELSGGLLSVTVYEEADLEDLLGALSYYSQCDKSGYLVIPETCTVIMTGMALLNLVML